MIECKSIEEAQQVKGVVHIVAGDPVIAYQAGDTLPDYCVVPPSPDEPSEMEQLKAQLAALQAQVSDMQASAVAVSAGVATP